MLATLRAKLENEPREVQLRVRVVQADMRAFSLRRRFDWVIAPFNTVLHLYTEEDVAGFLAAVNKHLSPGIGELVFDYATPRVKDLCLDPERWFKAGRVRHPPQTGGWVDLAERFHYSPQRQVLSTWSRFVPQDGTEPWEVLLTHRQFFPLEMRALLRFHGFTVQRWSADFSAQPPHAGADVLVVACHPERTKRAVKQRSR